MNASRLIPDGANSIRWTFRFSAWNPTAQEWSEACSRIQPEEVTRIHRFVFKQDAQAALGGRLLLRNFLTQALKIPNGSLVLARTEKGKPYLLQPEQNDPIWHFNLSHSGDYVFLGAEKGAEIGVDVMKTEFPRRKNLAEYFTLMKSQFSAREWTVIQSNQQDIDKLRDFYRLWCLKESYVKALGVGIGYNVSRLDFDLPTTTAAEPGSISLTVDGEIKTNWTFSELVVDENHLGAVAIHAPPEITGLHAHPQLVTQDIVQLLHGLEQLCALDADLGRQYLAKPTKPF